MQNGLKDKPDINNKQHTDNLWDVGERERIAASARAEGDATAAEQAQLTSSGAGGSEKKTGGATYTKALKTVFKGNPHKNPLVLILIALFGGGGLIAVIFAPGITLLSLADTLERDLNSQLSAWDQTSNQLWRSKLKKTVNGSCGKVNVPVMPCRWASVPIKSFDRGIQQANNASDGKLTVDYDRRGAVWGMGRGKITELWWTEPSGQRHDLSDPKAFAERMKTDIEFRRAILVVHNPRFHAFKTQTALDFYRKNKTSLSKKLNGSTEEEVRESKAQAVKGESSVDFKQPTYVEDEEGNRIYSDPDTGRVLTPEEVEKAQQQESKLASSPSTNTLLKNLAKGAMVTGALDTACTVYNLSRAVYTGAKVMRGRELIQYFMVFNTEAHAMKAEMSTPETVKVASDDVMHMEPKNQVADETKMASTPAGQPLPMIDNPHGGKTGMDSPVLAMSSGQDYPTKGFDASTQALMPGGGFSGTLGGINVAVANALGASDPATITQRCQIVQNVFVRTGALAIGIAAGIGTFGASTAASIAGSTLIGFALPYLTAQLADMAAGNVTANLKGLGAVSAIAMGGGLLYNGLARSNGLMSMSPSRMADYQNRKRETMVMYDEVDQLAAKEQPFDVTNKFSFAGTLARTSLPVLTQIKRGGLGTVQSLGSIASLAATSILPTTSADDERTTLIRPDRYKLCNDPDYEALGDSVAVDPTCVMVFGLPNEGMSIDPEENALWMVQNNEVVASSDTGEPVDNDQDWNYKKFLEQCVIGQPGVSEDPETNPTNGSGCVDEKNFDKNWHYAKFKLSYEVNLAMEQELPGMKGGADDSFASSTGKLGLDGWAYPTDKEKTQVSSKFGHREGGMHYGTDLAGDLDTPIYAARDGEVIAAGPASGFGNWIVIRHEMDGKRVDTVYGHMAASGVLVKRGDKVKAGDHIGAIGNEGFSTGPHLHFEVWDGGRSDTAGGSGKAIDPQPYLDKAAQTSSGNSTPRESATGNV